MASATPPARPTPTAILNPQRAPTATPSPAIFAAKTAEQPAPHSAAVRPTPVTAGAESASRNDGWFLALGGGAVILAAMLGGVAILLWRRRHA